MIPEWQLSGLADEAGDDLAAQLRAHAELGWTAIEPRLVGRRTVTVDLPEPEFAQMVERIAAANLQVTAVASAIGNWSRPITGDFEIDRHELASAIPRLRRLGCTRLRTMSWKRGDASETYWRDEAIRRYRELAAMAEAGGVVLLHENCEGWAGQSAEHTREFIAAIGSNHVGVLFDIGNTISHGFEPWPFYTGVRPLIRYVHIKDCRKNPAGGSSGAYSFPGEGNAQVKEILSDLLRTGYTGVVSMEPHVAAVVHLGVGLEAGPRYQAYLEYGRRVERLLAQIKAERPEIVR